MQTKSKHNRLAAVFLALAMLLTSLSFSMFAGAEEAAGGSGDGVYVLESKNLTAFAAGDKADSETEKAGTDDYFTLYYSAKAKVDSSSKNFDDGYESAQRVNFGGKADVANLKNAISFTTTGKATVKVWWVQGGDDNRQVVIYDKSGKEIDVTEGTWTKNSPYISTLEVPDANTYFLGGKENNNNFYKVEVTEQVPKDYVLESKNLTAFAAGDKADSETEKAGTDDYFTLYYSAKAKVDSSSKNFDDGYESAQRVNFGGKADVANLKNAISFTTTGKATVKVWWVQGGDDNRQVVIYDKSGKEIDVTEGTWTKNSPYISTLEVPDANTYFLGGKENNNNFYKVQVTDGGGAPVVREDWDKVAAPVITDAAQEKDKDGNNTDNIIVNVDAVVGAAGGDAVVVTMHDKDGKELLKKQSLAEKDSHKLTFAASSSGTYTFKANLIREGETDKPAAETMTADFVLTLKTPIITSLTSRGKGSVEIEWSAVPEATGYIIYLADGENTTELGKTEGGETTVYTAKGLTVGKEASFKVAAVRDSETGKQSEEKSVTVTEDAKSKWSYSIYGVSVDEKNNGVIGDANEPTGVTVYSENGKGKIVGGGADGVTFYYTTVPADKNFTFRAKMHVDKWKWSNGQEAMGLMLADDVPEMFTNPYWTNVYYYSLGTIGYYWDNQENDLSQEWGVGDKYDMRLGLGVYPKVGITPENQASVGTDAALTSKIDPNIQYALDTTAAELGLPTAARYNLAGNHDGEFTAHDNLPTLATDFDLEVKRNNTGYFFTYYKDGKVVRTQKFYNRDELSVLDEENIYVGFFAARNARATFTDVQLDVYDPDPNEPVEKKPAIMVTPRINITSSNVSNSENYQLMFTTSVDGKVTVSLDGRQIASKNVRAADDLSTIDIVLPNTGANKLDIVYTPDPNSLEEGKELKSDEPVETSLTVTYNTKFAEQNYLYVSPNGTSKGNGGPDYPLDIQTAMNAVQPGQTIVVMEGTYKVDSSVLAPRGNNGTADKMIYMIADPEAKTRPVFDGQGKSGIVVQLAGDYWL